MSKRFHKTILIRVVFQLLSTTPSRLPQHSLPIPTILCRTIRIYAKPASHHRWHSRFNSIMRTVCNNNYPPSRAIVVGYYNDNHQFQKIDINRFSHLQMDYHPRRPPPHRCLLSANIDQIHSERGAPLGWWCGREANRPRALWTKYRSRSRSFIVVINFND